MDAEGYVTEIPYIAGYYRELNPSIQSLALARAGFSAWRRGGPLNYLELGCGFGLSTLIHAAANPQATFIGVDILPSHVETANVLAAQAGITNARFLECSFATLGDHDLPDFDTIALHGVWSWINDANRAHILTYVDRKLKPDGALFLSYNAMPGHSALLALRRLMMQRFCDTPGRLPARVAAAVDYADRTRRAGAAFFEQHPTASARLDDLRTRSQNSLAHEYFNADWHPFYHADIVEQLRVIGLSFASSAQIINTIDALNFSPAARLQIDMEGELTAQETLRDYYCNRQFRADIFARGKADAATIADTMETSFVSGTPPEHVDNIVARTTLGKVRPDRELARAILDALVAGPSTIGAIARHPGCSGYPESRIVDTVFALAAMMAIEPTLPTAGEPARRARTSRLNSAIWQKAAAGEWANANASSVTGGGVQVTREEQLFMLAQEHGEDPAGFAIKILDEPEMAVRERYRTFQGGRLRSLRKLGIG